MPSVGSITFDVMKGLPQAYLTPTQVTGVQAGCLSIGMKSPESPAEDGGDIETSIKKLSESACIDLAADCRAIVGTIVTVSIDTGADVPYQFISAVECKWRRVGGFGTNLYLFQAKWKLVPLKQANGNGEDLTVLSEVWTAKIWGQWTRQTKLRCYGAGSGLGSYAGECDLVQKIGTVGTLPEDEADALGKWVEIRAKTSVTGTPKPVWWGQAKSKALAHTESGPELTFQCVGLVDVFRQAQLNRWYDLRNNTTVADPGSVVPFNGRPVGDASSAATFSLDPATPAAAGSFRIHDRAQSAGHAWQALDVVTTALAAFMQQYPGGPTWTLTGQTSALAYQFAGNMEFASMFDILQACVSPSRSLFFHIDVPLTSNKSTDVVNIEICTGIPENVNVPGNGNPAPAAIVIPGASRNTTVDLTPTEVTEWDLSEDESDRYDDIFVQAPRPLHVTALGFPSSAVNTAPGSIGETVSSQAQLTKDWTNAEETAWLAADDATRNQPTLIHVFRRFRLRALWDGRPYSSGASVALGIKREIAGNNETGEFFGLQTEADNIWPDGRTIKLSRALPIPAGLSGDSYITGSSVATIDHTKPPEKVQLFQVSGSIWRIINDIYEISTANGSSIEIGRTAAHGLALKAILESGKDLVAVVGYEWPLPWRVSWRRDAPGTHTTAPRDLDRSVIIPISGDMHTWRRTDRNVVVRVNGTAVVRTAAGVDWYKPGTIYQALEMAKLRYTTPRRSLNWTLTGSLDLDNTLKPGVLIKTADVPYGSRVSKTHTVNAVLTRRSWSFLASAPKTTYSAEPSLPEVDSVISMGGGANGPAGGGAPQGVYQ